MARLSRDFEAALQEALLDAAEHEFVGRRNNLVFQAIQESHDVLRAYGSQHDYDVESVIDALGQVEVDRGAGRLTVTWGWEHPAAPYFAYGTSEHTVDGEPVLSFVWEDPPAEIAEQFEDEGDGVRVFFESVDVDGLPESRFVRAGLDWLRREVR